MMRAGRGAPLRAVGTPRDDPVTRQVVDPGGAALTRYHGYAAGARAKSGRRFGYNQFVGRDRLRRVRAPAHSSTLGCLSTLCSARPFTPDDW